MGDFPSEIEGLGEDTVTLYLLLFLAGVGALLELHRERGIPDAVTTATLSDIAVWARAHQTGGMSPVGTRPGEITAGVWGLGNLGWPWQSLTGEIVRVGRLQHKIGTYAAPFSVWRNRGSGAVQMVCAEDGIGFDSEGLLSQEGAAPAWVSEHAIGAGRLTATPIAPTGVAEREPVVLALEEWEVVLESGAPILEIHIPEGSPMGMEECGAGLRQTVAEYSTWAGGHEWVAFTCSSWMLDPHYAELLKPSSNIVRLARET